MGRVKVDLPDRANKAAELSTADTDRAANALRRRYGKPNDTRSNDELVRDAVLAMVKEETHRHELREAEEAAIESVSDPAAMDWESD